MPGKTKKHLCLALDVDSGQQAVDLATELSPWVGLFKVGSQLFTATGPAIIDRLRQAGGEVFLDLKFHDIPNTVAAAGRIAVRHQVLMFNIHTAGGYRLMATVAEAVREEAERLGLRRPLLLGVTVLTSINADILKEELRVALPLEQYVAHLARLAQQAGLDGVVASPREIGLIRQTCGAHFIILTPGIRPRWSVEPDDQQRVTTPREALEQGSDYI
ncbi:MAG: orotidine-5'-phosphate decarboxylase, partial [Nitrospinota bacterium]